MKDALIIILMTVGASFFSLANIYMWLLIRRLKAELKTAEEGEGELADVPIMDLLYEQEA